MPSVFMDKNSIRIELTQAEVASYGFALSRSQLMRKKRKPDGGVVLELSSIDSTKSVESSEVVVWIPPAQIYPDSSACRVRPTTRPDASPASNGPASFMEDFTRPYSSVSGHHTHGADWDSSGSPEEATIGAGIPTSSPAEREISS